MKKKINVFFTKIFKNKFQTSSPLAVKTEEVVGTPPPPSGGEYLDSGHTQLSSVSSPPISGLRDPAPPISTLAATQNSQSATMLATTAADTSTTPSASHMPSYGTGLTSPSAAAYGASSLSAYGSTYPYGTLVSDLSNSNFTQKSKF